MKENLDTKNLVPESNPEQTEVQNEDAISQEEQVDKMQEVAEALANDPDFQKLKEQQAELMRLIDDSRVMRSYKKVVNDIYGVGIRKPVSKKEKKKKKAKRRMAKQSKR